MPPNRPRLNLFRPPSGKKHRTRAAPTANPSQPDAPGVPRTAMSALRPNYREKKSGNAENALINGLVDPTKTGKYPVLLSDTLLGRTQKDVFTSVRYNTKPQHSSDTAPALSRLKPSTPGSKTDFELSYQDDGGTYAYSGTRSTDQGQYVLYFDPEKKAFILDRVDSTFNMNLTRNPDNTDPDSLRREFKHIDISSTKRKPNTAAAAPPATSSSAREAKPAAARSTTSKPSSQKPKSSTQSIGKAASSKKERKAAPVALALPQGVPAPAPPAPAKKDKRAAADDEDEDEDDDDFGGLTIEYPDDPPARGGPGGDFSPANKLHMRAFSDFLRDSADDADGESDPDEDEAFKLPSPVGQQPAHHQQDDDDMDDEEEEDEQLYQVQHDRMDVDSPAEAGQDDNMDLVDDLEADLEAALEAANSGDAGEESEVSEED